MPRYKPYTDKGIKRIPCMRCGKPSRFQWNICALGKQFNAICEDCDIALNELVLDFMRVKNAEYLKINYRMKVKL